MRGYGGPGIRRAWEEAVGHFLGYLGCSFLDARLACHWQAFFSFYGWVLGVLRFWGHMPFFCPFSDKFYFSSVLFQKAYSRRNHREG
jgi:hypothetical protein